MQGVRHLVQCHCVLPQFRKRKDPVFHKFVVFSVIDDDDNVIEKQAACNNCGVIHKVTEINKSEIVPGKDTSRALMTKKELSFSLPKDIVELFNTYEVDLPVWEHSAFIMANELWGTTITFTQEEEDGEVSGKTLTFLEADRFRVTPFSRSTLGG